MMRKLFVVTSCLLLCLTGSPVEATTFLSKQGDNIIEIVSKEHSRFIKYDLETGQALICRYSDDVAKATNLAYEDFRAIPVNTAGASEDDIVKAVVNGVNGGLLQKGLHSLSKEELLILIKESTTTIADNGIIVKTMDAATANQQFTGVFFERFGYSIDFSKIYPPHASLPNGINDFKLLDNKLFIRIYPSNSNPYGKWLVSLEDFKQFKSLQEIKNKLALPALPSKFSIAEIPSGNIIRESKAAKVIADEGIVWGEGGSRQYMIQDYNESVAKEWFIEVGDISSFIK
jgi:hypothetical protein